ncbi:MAG: winged helix-turn-helix domain-containing protein [Dehalococcoidia bacterium]
MRILVVAYDLEAARSRAIELRRGGLEVSGSTTRMEATAALRRLHADAVVLLDDGPAPLDISAIRALVGRLRGAAESPLPAVLLLEDDSVWLRARPAADLSPITALPSDAPTRSVHDALDRLEGADGPLEARSSAVCRLDAVRREVSGPGGAVALTPSELTVAWALATAGGGLVGYDALSRALWDVPADVSTRAALRTHLHTLRGKLRRVSPTLEVENRPGLGYRLGAPLVVREPRG